MHWQSKPFWKNPQPPCHTNKQTKSEISICGKQNISLRGHTDDIQATHQIEGILHDISQLISEYDEELQYTWKLQDGMQPTLVRQNKWSVITDEVHVTDK